MNKLTPEEVRFDLAMANNTLKIAKLKYKRTVTSIIEGCPHDWKYVPDPRGNNDNGYSCNICGSWK